VLRIIKGEAQEPKPVEERLTAARTTLEKLDPDSPLGRAWRARAEALAHETEALSVEVLRKAIQRFGRRGY